MDGSFHLRDYLFPEKEQGFLQLTAFSPCLLWKQQSTDGVGDLDVVDVVGERLEREGDFTETVDLKVREETRFYCRSSERRFSEEEETQLW